MHTILLAATRRGKGTRCAVGSPNDYPACSALGDAPAPCACADDLPIVRPDSLHDSFKQDGHCVMGLQRHLAYSISWSFPSWNPLMNVYFVHRGVLLDDTV